ncbi:MAG: hypothetical protein F4174_02645 [Acidobacteria bacterium]|nr:hypothetical protein [Gammaproteobacteria bacterium]MYF76257.1 hypothetical protein [Acidobacteriota bacterium]
MTSNPNDLNARQRSRIQAERRQFEEVTASKLRRFGERSRAVVNDALHSIEADTGTAVARTRVILLTAWLRPLVVGLTLLLTISGGNWGLMHWLATGIRSRIETRAALDVQIEDARGTVAEIEETTWGVTLLEIGGEPFAVLPDGTRADPPWTVDGRPALKLPSE